MRGLGGVDEGAAGTLEPWRRSSVTIGVTIALRYGCGRFGSRPVDATGYRPHYAPELTADRRGRTRTYGYPQARCATSETSWSLRS